MPSTETICSFVEHIEWFPAENDNHLNQAREIEVFQVIAEGALKVVSKV